MEQQVSRPLGHGEEERPYPLPDCLSQSIALSLSGRVQARNHIRAPGRLRVRPRSLGQHIVVMSGLGHALKIIAVLQGGNGLKTIARRQLFASSISWWMSPASGGQAQQRP